MKRIVFILAVVFGFTFMAQAGWLDSVKDATKDAVKKNIQEQTKEAVPEPLKKSGEVAPDAVKQNIQEQTKEAVPEPLKQGVEAKPALPSTGPQISGISPDQADANACSQYVHEDWKKSEKALKESNLKWGSSRYLPKKEWIDYMNGRYPNMKKKDFYFHYGKWFGKSCAYVTLTCRPKEPGCDIQMKCLDFYTRKGGLTCPPNLCTQDDKKCIEPYKPPVQ